MSVNASGSVSAVSFAATIGRPQLRHLGGQYANTGSQTGFSSLNMATEPLWASQHPGS